MTPPTDFDAFAEAFAARRRRAEQLTPVLVSALKDAADGPLAHAGAPLAESVHAASGLLTEAVGDLGRAEEELRVQNEALFAAQTELAQEYQLFRDLFDQAPVSYLVTTRLGVLMRVNAAATRLLARPANALVGKPIGAYVALADRAAFRIALDRSASSPHAESWGVRLMRRDGTEVECRVHTSASHHPASGKRAAYVAPILLHWVITEAAWDITDDLV